MSRGPNAELGRPAQLEKTAQHALFLRAGRAAKYKVKTAIDTFFYRAGDVLQAFIVIAGTSLSFTIRQYALINVACAIASLGIVFAIDREYRAGTAVPDMTVRDERDSHEIADSNFHGAAVGSLCRAAGWRRRRVSCPA